MGGELITRHCTDSTAKTYRGDQWVTVEVEVHGNKLVKHIVEGKVVIEYNQPQLDERDPHARRIRQDVRRDHARQQDVLHFSGKAIRSSFAKSN